MSEMEFTAAAYATFLAEHKLMGTRCTCQPTVYLPPKPICPHCQSTAMTWVALQPSGRLEAYAVVYIGSTPMIAAGYDRKKPYCVGVVRLADGPAISAQILGVDVLKPESIAVGLPLTATFVVRGEGEAQKTYLAFETQAAPAS